MEQKNNTKNKKTENPASDKRPTEPKLANEAQNLHKHVNFEQAEKDLNSKILKITMRIKDHYPELSKYLEEMPVTIPSENDPEITLNHLKSYYESLNSLLKNYKMDHPKTEE